MGEEAYVPSPEEDYNPGADKILVDKANNTITFVYDETDTELMKQYNALPTFADVPVDAWYQLYVSHLSQLGIVSGRTESSFMPQEAVTRAEFAKMLTLAAEADLSSCSGVTGFADVEPDAWYAAPMEWASASGIIEGKTPTAFFPNDNITREEAGVMLYRLAVLQDSRVLQESEESLGVQPSRFTDEASISDWAMEPVEELRQANILLGDSSRSFQPQDPISRNEVAKMLSAYLVFSSHPILVTSTGALEYIGTPDNLEIPLSPEEAEEAAAEEAFHKAIADQELARLNQSELNWRSAPGEKDIPSTHKFLVNQGFYILFEDNGRSYKKVDNLSDNREFGKYSKIARGFVQEGSVWPDTYEKDNYSNGHYCSKDLKNKYGGDKPTAYTKMNDHYYLAKENYSWGSYEAAYKYLGKSMHYLSDINSPPHARLMTGKPHTDYETWVRDNMRSDYSVTSVSSSTYKFMQGTFKNISINFATLSNDASQSIFRIQPGVGYFAYLGSTTVSHTRDCLTRNERAIAGLAYRYLVDTYRAPKIN